MQREFPALSAASESRKASRSAAGGVVVGIPQPEPDDARRAILCAREIIRLIARWNAKRGFDPPVRVGIGLHGGEAFCGVLGARERLEFTVLGDVVNVAACMEQVTKRFGTSLGGHRGHGRLGRRGRGMAGGRVRGSEGPIRGSAHACSLRPGPRQPAGQPAGAKIRGGQRWRQWLMSSVPRLRNTDRLGPPSPVLVLNPQRRSRCS
jgi:Adenylate and Guanylate cyclase catalytic domain